MKIFKYCDCRYRPRPRNTPYSIKCKLARGYNSVLYNYNTYDTLLLGTHYNSNLKFYSPIKNVLQINL